MGIAFILRFQEDCCVDERTNVSAGTMTKTAVATEQPDSDPRQGSFTALPLAALQAGTTTGTRVRTEQGDKDHTEAQTAIPRRMLEMGTKTSTLVKAEGADRDLNGRQQRVFARCS